MFGLNPFSDPEFPVPQLLYQSSPIMAGALQLTGPMLDQYLTGQSVFYFDYSTTVEVRMSISSLVPELLLCVCGSGLA